MQAINLYLQGGLPGKAALVVHDNPQLAQNTGLMETIASSLFKAQLYEKAGDFFERLGLFERALDAYRRGHAYTRAVELARSQFRSEVVVLEEVSSAGRDDCELSCGFHAHLVSLFCRRGVTGWPPRSKWTPPLTTTLRPVPMPRPLRRPLMLVWCVRFFVHVSTMPQSLTRLSAQWNKAVQYIDILDLEVAQPFYVRLARHFDESRLFEEAEKYYVLAEDPNEAVSMYMRQAMWNDVFRVVDKLHFASACCSPPDELAHHVTAPSQAPVGARCQRPVPEAG